MDTESFYIHKPDTNRCFILVNYEGKQKENYSEMFSISLSPMGGSGNTWNLHILEAEVGETALLWPDGEEPSTA